MKKYISILSLVVALLATWSCAGDGKWAIEGAVEGGDSTVLYLEAPRGNGWYIMDSVMVDENGEFEFNQAIVGYPEIFRLKANGRTVYFPIDSIETVTYKGYAFAIDSSYTLSGSKMAETMMVIDQKIAQLVATKGEQAVATDSLLKRELSAMIIGDKNGLLSYYIINKRVGNTMIFDMNNKSDLRIIGAVANKFSEQRPNDPRTESLKQSFLKNRRMFNVGTGDTLQVSQTALFDINLYDNKGKLQSLKEVSSKGNVTILNFTIYATEQSPLFNIALNKIYDAYKSSGLEIYQVSVDQNEMLWKESAENIPWITVYNSPTDGAKNLMNYNVTLLPASFIIDRNGDIVERVDDVAQLEKLIKKYI